MSRTRAISSPSQILQDVNISIVIQGRAYTFCYSLTAQISLSSFLGCLSFTTTSLGRVYKPLLSPSSSSLLLPLSILFAHPPPVQQVAILHPPSYPPQSSFLCCYSVRLSSRGSPIPGLKKWRRTTKSRGPGPCRADAVTAVRGISGSEHPGHVVLVLRRVVATPASWTLARVPTYQIE